MNAVDEDSTNRRSRGLDRAFEILDFLRAKRKPMRPNEIAVHIGAPRSSVYELVNLLLKHGALEYVGSEDVDGTEAHKLTVKLANGDVQYVWFDPDAFLVIRTLKQRTVRGVERREESDYSDYEKVNGTYVAFATSSGGVGDTQKSTFTVEKAEANVALEDSWFAFPAGGK